MPTEGLVLERPSETYRVSYRSYVQELAEREESPVPFTVGFPHEDFPAFLNQLEACSRGEGLPEGFIPHSTYWLVREGRDVIGVSNLRHRLNERLLRDGGSIGYGVRPSARGKGFARELLRQTLQQAANMGLDRALLTCARTNVRSVRTILANGGILESEEFHVDRGEFIQKYWIDLSRSSV